MFRFSIFSRSGFLSGMARVLDMGATLNEYNYTSTPEMADKLAIMSDFMDIGADMFTVIKQYEQTSKTEKYHQAANY